MNKMNMYAQLLIDEAKRRNIEVDEIDYQFNLFALKFRDKTIHCRESLTEMTSAYTMTICSNKWLTLKFLREKGLSVPRQHLWQEREKGLEFLRSCNNRLVVKPLNGEQGRGITVDVRTAAELDEAVAEALKYDSTVLLEEFKSGRDLRIIVIDYKFVAAIERIPATVTGDGTKTLEELIINRNEELLEATDGESKIPVNSATALLAEEQGLAMDEIPAVGKAVKVCRLANFHSGGTIEDVTEAVSKKLKDAAEEAARILKIPVVGLDLLVPDISGDDYEIIEANERPGLANHEPQPTAERFIDFLFPETAG
ncbi:MAG: ATP-grasp domain-containing protein [Bacillota bacterium]|nr:ATP-grasp domain-containing protein [Bacillota bacterium]